jgi:hypothetical protein
VFLLKKRAGQWIGWDFHKMRIRPSHYVIWAQPLKSSIVEGSINSVSWTEIDRQKKTREFKEAGTASFAVSSAAEFRFIRLTQTGKRHNGDYQLALRAVEFFGTISE